MEPFVVDRSELGKLALAGAQAKEFLNGQVTNDVEALEPGHGLYAAFLTPKGKMLGDLRVLDRGDELLLITERIALQALFDQTRRAMIGWDARLDKRTLQMGLLSVIGADPVGVPAQEHAHVPYRGGLAVRTDLGIDIVVPSDELDAARAELRLPERDEDAWDRARVERGLPRYGVDLDDSVIPQEAGLNDRAVSFTKGCYVGQETVARLHYKGKPNRHLRGLRLASPAQPGTPLRAGEREVGTLGSAVVSPTHGPIGLALVRREVAPGDEILAGDTPATVVELPF